VVRVARAGMRHLGEGGGPWTWHSPWRSPRHRRSADRMPAWLTARWMSRRRAASSWRRPRSATLPMHRLGWRRPSRPRTSSRPRTPGARDAWRPILASRSPGDSSPSMTPSSASAPSSWSIRHSRVRLCSSSPMPACHPSATRAIASWRWQSSTGSPSPSCRVRVLCSPPSPCRDSRWTASASRVSSRASQGSAPRASPSCSPSRARWSSSRRLTVWRRCSMRWRTASATTAPPSSAASSPRRTRRSDAARCASSPPGPRTT